MTSTPGWEELLDDLSWLDDDDDLDDVEPLEALRSSAGLEPIDASIPTSAQMKASFDRAFVDEGQLISLFPEIEVAISAAEDVDDRVPDPAHASLDDLRWAVQRYEAGIAECAELKLLAEGPLFDRVARPLKASIRDEKAKIMGWRDRLMGTLRTKEREAQNAPAGQTAADGFSSWAGSSVSPAQQARRNAEHEAKMRRLQKETAAIMAATRRGSRIAAENRFKTMNRALFGSRYY